MAQTFGAWLKRQAHRDDFIGDLAQDFIRDINATGHGYPSQWSPRSLRHRLMYLDACPGAFDALEAAVTEWKQLARVQS